MFRKKPSWSMGLLARVSQKPNATRAAQPHHDQSDDGRRPPPVGVGLDEGVGERAQSDDGEDLSGDVEAAALGVLGFAHEPEADEERDQPMGTLM